MNKNVFDRIREGETTYLDVGTIIFIIIAVFVIGIEIGSYFL